MAWVSEDRVFQLLLHARLFKSDPGIGRACIVVSLRETALFLWKDWRQERFFRRELRGVSVNPIREVCGWVWVYEIEQTANLHELTRIAFFLRRRALLRLIAYAESHAVWKNAGGKTVVPVFLFVNFSFCVIEK
ncbi:MAG: hypothetical protein VB020_04140 [Methanocorpusculum sp.]|nr:hypothetical protein [Methanocorpusculum sp.]